MIFISHTNKIMNIKYLEKKSTIYFSTEKEMTVFSNKIF